MFFICVTGTAFAQEPAYQIADITYDIEGRTRVWALEDILELETELTFATLEELEEFLAQQEQILVNQRILQEASVHYRVASEVTQSDSSPRSVHLLRTTDPNVNVSGVGDHTGHVELHRPSIFQVRLQHGLLLSLRTRDYNFFGTNQTLSIDFDYERTDKEEDLFTIAADFRLPFNLFDHRWEAIVEQKLEIEDSDLDFELSTGLGLLL